VHHLKKWNISIRRYEMVLGVTGSFLQVVFGVLLKFHLFCLTHTNTLL
jgi:hypothetical protein